MKATINGVVLEGTAEEIFAYQKLIEKKTTEDHFDKFKGIGKEFDLKKVVKQIEDEMKKKPIIFGYY